MERTLQLLASLSISEQDFFLRSLTALGIGFVLGLEREHARKNEEKNAFAGVRTFMLVALWGVLATFLSFPLGNWLLPLSLAVLAFLVATAYKFEARHAGGLGGTTEVALILTFLLGCATALGYTQESLAATVVMAIVLSMKVRLHNLAGQITQEELVAFLKFCIIAVLVLPYLPEDAYDPYGVLKPREIGWVIVLTSGIGFGGYLLVKFMGARQGTLLAGILGGLVSSTAVTWVFSKKSQEMPSYSASCAVAILAAATIMVLRVAMWIYFFNASLLPALVPPLALIAITGMGIAVYLYKKQGKEALETDLPAGNPINLKEAALFGVMYAGITLLVSYANTQFGTKGIYIASGVAALTDIDAITISVAKLGGHSIPAHVAQYTILLATLSNTIVKIGIASWAGHASLKRYIWLGYGAIFVAGLIGFAWLMVAG